MIYLPAAAVCEACIRSSTKHICFLYVLTTDYVFLQTFVMHSRSKTSDFFSSTTTKTKTSSTKIN